MWAHCRFKSISFSIVVLFIFFTPAHGQQLKIFHIDVDQGDATLIEAQGSIVIVDGGPKLISFVMDGILCDGSGQRQFGWGRYSPHLRHANGLKSLLIGPSLKGRILSLRIYDRYLRTAEAIANFQALHR